MNVPAVLVYIIQFNLRAPWSAAIFLMFVVSTRISLRSVEEEEEQPFTS